MHAIIKILFGALLLIGSVSYIYTNQYGSWSDFLTVINGLVPPFIGLLGLFIIWLELDELKVKKEVQASSRKAKRKR